MNMFDIILDSFYVWSEAVEYYKDSSLAPDFNSYELLHLPILILAIEFN